MGILFSKLYTLLFASEEVKILILGLDNSGKSTILYRLSLGSTVATTPTLGANIEQLSYGNLKVIMWDLGGQSSLRQSWSAYYSGARSVVLVVDSTDRERVGVVKEELAKIMAHDVGWARNRAIARFRDEERRAEPSRWKAKEGFLRFLVHSTPSSRSLSSRSFFNLFLTPTSPSLLFSLLVFISS